MKRLIVNADDFGLTGKVNDAIVEGHRNGIITSTTLMANGAAFESAVALARRQPRLGVGVHLNLTEGRPISDGARIPSLVNGRGLLSGGPGRLARRVFLGRIRLADVERELRAQIEKVLAAGIPATHIDGHKHVHLWPSIFDVVIRLAREYGIRCVRRPAERPVGLSALLRRGGGSASAILRQYLASRAMRVVALGSRRKLRRGGLNTPEYFFGVTQTGFLDVAALGAILRCVPEGTSEIMCHPGYVDEDLMRTPTRLLRQRERELAALMSPEIRNLVAAMNIELVHYGQLAETR
jgi:hopanoid biosynthesis associated protein HpnK